MDTKPKKPTQTKNFINGKFVSNGSSNLNVISPLDGSLISKRTG